MPLQVTRCSGGSQLHLTEDSSKTLCGKQATPLLKNLKVLKGCMSRLCRVCHRAAGAVILESGDVSTSHE